MEEEAGRRECDQCIAELRSRIIEASGNGWNHSCVFAMARHNMICGGVVDRVK